MHIGPIRTGTAAFGIACAMSASLAAQSADVTLREGDRVLVKLWMDSAFSEMARVQDGAVILPRLGAVSIQNLPTKLIPDSVRRAYASVFRSVVVEVTPLIKVTMSGEVLRPAVLFLDVNTPTREAVAVAGGITPTGRTSPILLVREGRTIRLSGGVDNASFDTPLRSGDIVIVERESWFKRNAPTMLSAISLLISVISLATR